jgi:hypothetical protein
LNALSSPAPLQSGPPADAVLRQWLAEGTITQDESHVKSLASSSLPMVDEHAGRSFGRRFRQQKAIMGVFDEGCMGMYNAIVPDEVKAQYEDPNARGGSETGNIGVNTVTASGRTQGDGEVRVNPESQVPAEKAA